MKNNFGKMYFVLSSSMKPPLNWVMHAILSSKGTVSILKSHFKPHLSLIKCITVLNHTFSLLASWMTIISTWFEEVAKIDCFVDRYVRSRSISNIHKCVNCTKIRYFWTKTILYFQDLSSQILSLDIQLPFGTLLEPMRLMSST